MDWHLALMPWSDIALSMALDSPTSYALSAPALPEDLVEQKPWVTQSLAGFDAVGLKMLLWCCPR